MNDLEDTLDATEPATRPVGKPRLSRRLARSGVLRVLAGLTRGHLRILDPLGNVSFGPAPADIDVTVRIHDTSAWLAIAAGGSVGAAEAYMDGKWTVSDPTALVRLLAVNREVMDHLESGLARLSGLVMKLAHGVRRNSRQGSRRNIRAHYDLGDDLFRLFLDPAMMYSSAVFPRADASLEEASLHKLDLICDKLQLGPADHLLEIGTGWGGLAVHAAGKYGCRVTTTTISRRQFDHATRRVQAAGLEGRVTVLGQDYRDLRGQFDKLVSVEMIEAVGHRFLDTYFRTCSERLKPAGRMVLQAIVMADRHHEQARRSVDFIQQYIFPGGALPSVGTMLASVARMTDLQIADLHDIGLDYARTLQLWRQRFMHRLQEVRGLGYPDEFIRMWEWYLAYCEGGFLERTISAVQVVFDKPDCRLQTLRCVS
ncbi:MAG: cyclopropane-fatty-acyl-phospholipid synthase family protein [Gammaproteobacteria bacterium]|nr:cyclopropane-fatty-acyl-phospholipid synthase family protein [Gammaproteobacteria bacterium]